MRDCLSSLWVSRTGSASDWCALQEALYKCIDTIQYHAAAMGMKCCRIHFLYLSLRILYCIVSSFNILLTNRNSYNRCIYEGGSLTLSLAVLSSYRQRRSV